MNRKNRTAGLITRTLVLAAIVLILSTGLVGAFPNPLGVPFKSQIPPGTSATKNCGQTSSLMVYSFYDGTTPTEQGIKNIDDWLFQKYGSSQAINGYDGSYTSTTILETLARNRGSEKYGGFLLSYKDVGWTLARIKQEINAGHPVIVAVTAGKLPNRGYGYTGGHFVVVKGYSSTHIITNDPGTKYGESKYYLNSDFTAAMGSGAVVMVIPNPVTVLSPKSGDVWSRYRSQTVKWKYSGDAGTSVKIYLVKGSSVYPVSPLATISIGSNGIGSYTFIPGNVPTGYGYKVRVTTSKGFGQSNMYYTDVNEGYFYIQ